MKYEIVKDAETWAKVETMGSFYCEFKNGELWEFNGTYYYLSHLELVTEELIELNEFYSGCVTI